MNLTEILAMDTALDMFADGPNPDPHIVAAGLTPPLPYVLLERPTLIWGWPIARAAALQGLSELEVQRIEVDWLKAIELAIRMEGRAGVLTLREQLAIVAAAHGAGIQVPNEMSELVRGNRGLHDVTHRISALPQHLSSEVVDGRLDLKVAERLRVLPAKLFSDHVDMLHKLTHSKRRQFLEMLAELTHRDALSDSQTEELADQALCASDPVEHIRRLRYPTLVGMEEQLSVVIEREFSGSGVTVSAPPYFEGDSYTVQFQFRSCDDISKRLAAAEHLKGCCEELLGLL